MSAWEAPGLTDEWYTPKYIFDALGCVFDYDPCPASSGWANVPCRMACRGDGLLSEWHGFVWMNPPFGKRNGIKPWLDKFFEHDNGIALTPDRTSAPWWQDAAKKAGCILFIAGKPRFERPDGSVGKQPGNGVTLMSVGVSGWEAIHNAERNGLGLVLS